MGRSIPQWMCREDADGESVSEAAGEGGLGAAVLKNAVSAAVILR